MSYTDEFFRQFNGYTFVYDTGHWWRIEIKNVRRTTRRPGGVKYTLAFFDADNHCLVRFDNSHGVKTRGKKNPIAFDHWHRFSSGELVAYEFIDLQTLIEDFFREVDRHLPPKLRADIGN